MNWLQYSSNSALRFKFPEAICSEKENGIKRNYYGS